MAIGIQELSTATSQIASFLISDIDDSTDIKYYGFLNRFGNWYLMQEDTNNKTYRYAKGDTDYDLNWGDRENLTYDYASNVFNK